MRTSESPSNHTLPSVVYQKLREAIFNGYFKPGQMLRQDEVAAKLGVSRSPLREALPKLEADGIVVSYPHRGYAVACLSTEQIIEVFDLRSLLETELARRSITRRTEADVAIVYGIAHEMAASTELTNSASVSKWFGLNMQFHTALLTPSDCPHHLRALAHARDLSESYIRTERRLTGDHTQAQEEHIELAQVFVMGDMERFVTLTRQHTEHTLERLLLRLSPTEFPAL